MTRPPLDWAMLAIASILALRACCERRQVGCVLTDARGIIVGAGYNGRLSGIPNCEGSDCCVHYCEGMHAEINALLRGTGRAANAYVTCAPCVHCTKALLAAGVTRLVVHSGQLDEDQRHGQALWRQFGHEILELSSAAGQPPLQA